MWVYNIEEEVDVNGNSVYGEKELPDTTRHVRSSTFVRHVPRVRLLFLLNKRGEVGRREARPQMDVVRRSNRKSAIAAFWEIARSGCFVLFVFLLTDFLRFAFVCPARPARRASKSFLR